MKRWRRTSGRSNPAAAPAPTVSVVSVRAGGINNAIWLFSSDVLATDPGDFLSIAGRVEASRLQGPATNELTLTYTLPIIGGEAWSNVSAIEQGFFDPDGELLAGAGTVL